MWAIVLKEFRELKRDPRTLGMLIALPVMLLVVFGYAANFEVSDVPTVIVGPQAQQVEGLLESPFEIEEVDPAGDRSDAEASLRDGKAVVGIVTGGTPIAVLMDGTQQFSVQAAQAAFARMAQSFTASGQPPPQVSIEILYNPDLKTSWIMIPGLTGLILLFIGTLITSLGIVRERQAGTIEQLAVMPFRPWDVIFGKIVPYFILASLDMILIVVIGALLFGVPFVGSFATFSLGAAIFLLVTLGVGILISSVSQNQGQSIQIAIMFVLPQVLLSGLIFPISSMAAGVRWIAYILPLSYYIQISRGIMLKGATIAALWIPLTVLAFMAVLVLGLAMVRFRRDLAPSVKKSEIAEAEPGKAGA